MTDLLKTIVELVKLGNLGVGIAALLMGFVLAFQSKPLDPTVAKFRTNFLWIAFAYAVVTALITVPPMFIKGAPVSERLAFSPDFESEKLQPPTVRLPDGTVTQHDAKFDLQPSGGTQVVTVTMDGTLDQVRNLRQASATLATTVVNVTKQRDTLAERAAATKQTSENQTKAPALQNLQANSSTASTIQDDVFRSLTLGNYARANQLTARLQSSVKAAEPAVAVIAKAPVNPH